MIDIEKTCEMLRNRSSMYNRKVVQKNNVPPGLENKSRIVGKGERFGINEEKCMEEKPYLSKLMGKRERFAEKQEEQFDIERDDGDSPKEQMQIKKLLSDYILPKEQFERGGEREECQERRPKQELKPRKWNLNQIEQAVLDKMNIIYHEGNLYWYTGRHYQIIRNGEELFRLIRAKVSKDAFGATSVKWISDLFMFLKTDPNLVPDDYEEKLLQAKTLISFKNGVLDLETMNLYNHSPDYLIFYTINAKWEKNTEAYHFKEFLKSMSGGDKSVAKRVKEALGYLLSVSNDGKYFFVMGTAPNSGKSTLGELLQEIVGREHVAHISTHQIGGRFALGDIHGKTLNLSMDLPKGKLSPVVVSIIKQITGGDVITTDQKYERMKEVHSNMRATAELSFDGSPKFTFNRAFPLLFRGGISFVSDTHFNQEGSVWDGKYQLSSVNVSGLSYVKAVQLEKSGLGPRLFCDQAFVDQIQDVAVKKGIRRLSENLYEIIWTYFGCEATERSNNIDQNAFKRADRLFLPRAINLYNYFLTQCNGNPDDPSKKVVEQYKELILLICRGIYKYVHDNGGNTPKIANYMNQMLGGCGKDFSWIVTDDELQYFLM